MSDKQDQDFPQFSRLPAELRLAIWAFCLPCRVVEIDQFQHPQGPADFCKTPAACTWDQTTKVNQRRLPRISQVCHESRQVALKAGEYHGREMPLDTEWGCAQLQNRLWIDPVRDSLHLYWDPSLTHDYCCPLKGSALDYLAYRAAQAQGGSFMFGYLRCTIDSHEKFLMMKKRLRTLRKLQNAAVVMRVIVIHMMIKDAGKTGLFGLLGDAPVQIVNVHDTERQDAFYGLAKKSTYGQFTTVPQDLKRKSPLVDQAALERNLLHLYGPEGAATLSSLYPAIMFRLCTQFCNQPFARIDNRNTWDS